MKKLLILGFAAVSMLLGSCSKSYLDVRPTTDVSKEDALTSVANIEASMQGTIAHQNQWRYDQSMTAQTSQSIFNDMMAGIIVRPHKSNGWWWSLYRFSSWDFDSSSNFYFHYRFGYITLKNLNMIIAATVNEFENMSASDKAHFQTLRAEALALRAAEYHKLSVYYGYRWEGDKNTANTQLSVPLILNETMDRNPRNTMSEVYAQIWIDLNEAISLFEANKDFEAPVDEDLAERPNIYMAYMLKARIQMYQHDYAGAYESAKKVIDSKKYSIMGWDEYQAGFNSVENKEWIWGAKLTATNPKYFASYFAYMGVNYSSSFIRTAGMCIDSRYVTVLPDSDVRKGTGTDGIVLLDNAATIKANGKPYYFAKGFTPTTSANVFPYYMRKYKQTSTGSLGAGDVVYMRLAEAYYIAAEAAYRLGNEADAQAMLTKAVLPYDAKFVAPAGAALYTAIKNYKAFDMYGEGRGFEDVKARGEKVIRTGSNHNLLEVAYENWSSIKGEENSKISKLIMDKSIIENNNLIVND